MNITMVFLIAVLLYLLFIWKAGKIFPILYLFIFTYFIQYVFSTFLIYNEYKILSYEMPIKQEQYFDYVIPALLALFAGVLFFNRDVKLNVNLKLINGAEAARLGYLLLFISLFFDLLKLIGIASFDSIISFTYYLKYLAAFCFLFTRSSFNYLLIILVYTQLGISVLRSGVFISFFIWSTFLFLLISLKYTIPFGIRVCFVVIFIPVIIVIQSVKREYRDKVWKQEEQGGLSLLSDLAEKQNSKEEEGPFSQSTGVIKTVGRLSQGWHLGLTLKQVPQKEPIANGNEMLGDIASSILPRIIFADKKSVNSQDKFFKYTGHRLRGSTSMSIGVLGDFYINFGRWGSFILLFVFGALISRLLYLFTIRYVISDPINIIWIPFLLSYLIRANNDFYIFFNCLVKGFIIFLTVNYIRYHFLGARKPQPAIIKPAVL